MLVSRWSAIRCCVPACSALGTVSLRRGTPGPVLDGDAVFLHEDLEAPRRALPLLLVAARPDRLARISPVRSCW